MKQMFLMIFIYCISYNVYAIDCPPSSTCTVPFSSATHTMYLDHKEDIRVLVELEFRVNCEGDFEMRINNFEGLNGNKNIDFLDEFNYLHYSYSSATEMIALDYLMNINGYFDDVRTIPLCTSGNSIKRIFVYSAACGVWTRCSYKLPSPLEYYCDTGWSGGTPHYDDNGSFWVDHWKWQSCGEICCKKVFEICRESNVSSPGYYVKIKGMTKGKYSDDLECSLQNTFKGNRPKPSGPNVNLQCEDGC